MKLRYPLISLLTTLLILTMFTVNCIGYPAIYFVDELEVAIYPNGLIHISIYFKPIGNFVNISRVNGLVKLVLAANTISCSAELTVFFDASKVTSIDALSKSRMIADKFASILSAKAKFHENRIVEYGDRASQNFIYI